MELAGRFGRHGTLIVLTASVTMAVALPSVADDATGPATEVLKEGDVICASRNILVEVRSMAFPSMDVAFGSCWEYRGKSAMGYSRIAPIDSKTTFPRGYEYPNIDFFKDHPFKIETDALASFVPKARFVSVYGERVATLHARWPDFSEEQLRSVLYSEVFLGMPVDAAEESVGWLVHTRSERTTDSGVIQKWEVGKRSLAGQVASESKRNMLTDAFAGPAARAVPLSPTADSITKDVIAMVLTFTGGRLSEIDIHTANASMH
jgi:hypothetical protein